MLFFVKKATRWLPLFRGSLIIFIALGLVSLGGAAGYSLGQDDVSSRIPAYLSHGLGISETNKQTDFSIFWQAWNSIDKKYYGDKEPEDRLQGAIAGMVASLKDPYTIYLEPTQNKLFHSDLEGSFGGIGAELTIKDSQLTVVSVLEDTPADQADVRLNDVIIEIDGTKAGELTFSEAIERVRGEKGTEVVLKILRKDVEQALDIKIIRDIITVKSVKTSFIGPDSSILYLKLNQFGQDTEKLVKTAFEDAVASGKKGIIIDLRNNPGGYLNSAVNIIGMVLPKTIESDQEKLRQRVAVLTRDKDGDEELDRALTPPIVADLPMVVLVNQGSASASEIFAGAMKDYKRADLVGIKTFGKGSVQDLVELENGGSVKITIAKWFTPLGFGIDKTGIEPDVKVEQSADEDESATDTQAKKALELLQQKIK